jgi:hypothetical protein
MFANLHVASDHRKRNAHAAHQGLFPAVTCGADFGALIRNQYDEYGRVIREWNIKAE